LVSWPNGRWEILPAWLGRGLDGGWLG